MTTTALTYQYAKLPANGRAPVQLESTYTHEKKGKYSFLGMDPYGEIIGKNDETLVIDFESGKTETKQMNALVYLKNHLPIMETHLPVPFFGGAVGYVGYDAIRDFVEIGHPLEDDLQLPAIHFMLFKDIIVFDHMDDSIYLIAVNPDGQKTGLEERIRRLEKVLNMQQSNPQQIHQDVVFRPQQSKESFIEKVKEAKTYIERGEVSQVVLSQRMLAEIPDPDTFACSFYIKLREKNPSPYMFYIDFSDHILLGASPESLLQVIGKEVITNPIAGTRPRGKTTAEDETLEAELLADDKELAEHRMLVELSKADLATVCSVETIHTSVDMEIEKYEHVMHIVSEVVGTLKEGYTSIDALIHCLPAGTVSGTPKKRAMQIINQLEMKMRGPYGGGVGYINFNRDLNIALTIRSLIIKDRIASLQAGAGIVIDSNPVKEYEETLHKARTMLETAEVFK